jgi:hypothetical protein
MIQDDDSSLKGKLILRRRQRLWNPGPLAR